MLTFLDSEKLIEPWQIKLEKAYSWLPSQSMMTNHERVCLGALLLSVNQNNGVLEFGTWRGLTTRWMSRLVPESKIYTVDCPMENMDTLQLAGQQSIEPLKKDEIGEAARFDNVIQFYGDSRDVDLSGISNLDLVFVDGGHSYETVCSDVNRGLSLLRRDRGIIVLHDFDIKFYNDSNLLNNNYWSSA